jgi:hypothetical protein
MRKFTLFAFIVSLFLVVMASYGIAAPGPLKPRVIGQDKNDVSPPMRQVKPVPPKAAAADRPAKLVPMKQIHEFKTRPGALKSPAPVFDPVIQNRPVVPSMPSPLVSFEGVSNIYGYLPPDTNGDVGPNHYIQWVNVSFAIWDKSGALLYGPADGDTLWQGFGGACEGNNHGDPIVLYDHLADRWFMSQFALPNFPNGPFYQCIAVSATGDPLGSWYRYQYSFTKMNDYPKFGVWQDGYYMSINQFNAGIGNWGGAGVAAFERDKMLAGQPAGMIYFDLYGVNPNYGGLLPADLDGPAPPAGAPNVFTQFDDDAWGSPTDRLAVWEFHVDWATPANSTFGLSGNPNSSLNTASFDSDLCGYARNCIPQPGGSALDAISDRLMYRLQYRNFGDHQAMVVNHTVDAGANHAGVRWYELRNTGAGWAIYQQGTYAPDADHRWMGSAAMDAAGNIAVGYSVSSGSTYPSIRYAGRLVSDPLDSLAQGETTLIAGGGVQQHSSGRWGDYSMMAVDPTDDCTFWYTQEYYAVSGVAPWQTRIGSFKFPNCDAGPTGTLQGTIKTSVTNVPISGAKVTLSSGLAAYTDGAGFYQLASVPVGTYSVTVSAYGFATKTVTGVAVSESTTTTKNVWMAPLALVTVQGTVTDGSGHGWPLYARIDIAGYTGGPVYTDPSNGHYSVALFASTPYDFTVSAMTVGYNTKTKTVTPPSGGGTENFALTVNSSTCSAPGYGFKPYFADTFEGGYTKWTMTGLWNPEAQADACGSLVSPFPSPTNAAYYGVDGVCNYNNGAANSGSLTMASPVLIGANATFNFWSYETTECNGNCSWDKRFVDISTDGGSIWTNIWVSGGPETSWHEANIDLTPYAGSQILVRFRFDTGDSVSNNYFGWMVDNVSVGGKCAPLAGGLVTGFVTDANTGLPLSDATVASAVKSTSTDTSGFYAFSLGTGSKNLTATRAGYASSTVTINVPADTAVRTDFALGSGVLSATPAGVNVVINTTVSLTANRTVTLSNAGTAGASFELVEKPYATLPTGLFQQPASVVKPFKQGFSTSAGLGLQAPPAASPFSAGEVLQSWPTGLPMSWGIAFDSVDNTVWVGSPVPAWGGGNNTMYEYSPEGVQTGRSYPFVWNPTYGPADGAFNTNTGKLWVMNVEAPGNCIFEIDPATGPTGNTICPGGTGFAVSQRGLAYDPTTDTYFAGSWNDGMIHHFNSAGTMLNEVFVGLPIAGLAYNPDTQHLFVMTNAAPNLAYVLDASNGFALIGQFSVPGFGDYSGAGLEIDCSGKLWAVNQATQTVYQLDSGETANFCMTDIPWLTETPTSGWVASGAGKAVTFSFDATGMAPGNYQALVVANNNTPYGPLDIPVALTVLKGKVTLFSPNGGETIPSGSARKITWGAVATATTFKLQYSVNNGASWSFIVNNVTGTSYDWTVPSVATGQGLVKVLAYNSSGTKIGEDVSDFPFTVEVVKLLSPNGGEPHLSGMVQYIVWQTHVTSNPVYKVDLNFSSDGGATWSKFYTILESNPGFIPWVVPYVRNANCLIKIELFDAGGAALGSDTSDAVFSVNF